MSELNALWSRPMGIIPSILHIIFPGTYAVSTYVAEYSQGYQHGLQHSMLTPHHAVFCCLRNPMGSSVEWSHNPRGTLCGRRPLLYKSHSTTAKYGAHSIEPAKGLFHSSIFPSISDMETRTESQLQIVPSVKIRLANNQVSSSQRLADTNTLSREEVSRPSKISSCFSKYVNACWNRKLLA